MSELKITMQTRNGSLIEDSVSVPQGIKNIEDSALVKQAVKHVYEEWNLRQSLEDR